MNAPTRFQTLEAVMACHFIPARCYQHNEGWDRIVATGEFQADDGKKGFLLLTCLPIYRANPAVPEKSWAVRVALSSYTGETVWEAESGNMDEHDAELRVAHLMDALSTMQQLPSKYEINNKIWTFGLFSSDDGY
jgi:hypothetical protein